MMMMMMMMMVMIYENLVAETEHSSTWAAVDMSVRLHLSLQSGSPRQLVGRILPSRTDPT